MGYHRLWSHRSFRANFSVRVVLAALGSAGFQGSIKVAVIHTASALQADMRRFSGGVCAIDYTMYVYENSCLRRLSVRLSQRFTDDLVHDPYVHLYP